MPSRQPRRSFPYKDAEGVWQHPSKDRELSNSEARKMIRAVERRAIVRNLAEVTGKKQADIRKSIRGVKTRDFAPFRGFEQKDGKKRSVRGDPRGKARAWLRRRGIVASGESLVRY